MNTLNPEWEDFFEKRRQTCGTATAMASLAFTTIVTILFSVAIIAWGAAIEENKEIVRLISQGVLLILLFAGWIPVAFFGIRRAFLAAGVVFLSGVATWAVLIRFSLETEACRDVLRKCWDFDKGILVIFGFLIVIQLVMLSTAAAIRTKYLYSKLSGRWLNSFVVAKGFIPDETAQPFEELDLSDVMSATPSIKKRGQCQLILYLDCISDGRHVLGLMMKRRIPFFSFKLSGDRLKRKAILITRMQAEQIAEKFGPVKKTFFIIFSINEGCIGKSA